MVKVNNFCTCKCELLTSPANLERGVLKESEVLHAEYVLPHLDRTHHLYCVEGVRLLIVLENVVPFIAFNKVTFPVLMSLYLTWKLSATIVLLHFILADVDKMFVVDKPVGTGQQLLTVTMTGDETPEPTPDTVTVTV
jgi:hypothetical protein